jgi:outer membrane protein assembly factor BamB
MTFSKNRISILVLIGFVLCVAIALSAYYARHRSGTPSARPSPVPARIAEADWPMFRGAPSLRGNAEGGLPEELELLWRFKTDAEVKSSPAIVDGIVYIGSSDSSIYAIDAATGKQEWHLTTGDAVESGPCVADGTVFVGSADANLYAIDAAGGTKKWSYETGDKILSSPNVFRDDTGQLRIVVGSYDSKLHCVDGATGRAVWVYETNNYVNGSAAVDGGMAVFGGCDGFIHAISVSDGNEIAAIDAQSYIAASAAFVDGRAYVGNYDNVFICADIDKDEIVWKYSDKDHPFFSSAAVGKNVLIFGSRDKRVHCIRRDDGKRVWVFQTQGEVDSSPVIVGDKVVVGSGDGRLYMLSLADGKQIWSFEAGQPIMSSPAVGCGIVVVGCDDGYVYAFHPSTQEQF